MFFAQTTSNRRNIFYVTKRFFNANFPHYLCAHKYSHNRNLEPRVQSAAAAAHLPRPVARHRSLYYYYYTVRCVVGVR